MRSFGRQEGGRTRRRASAPAVAAAARTWAEQLESRVLFTGGGTMDALPYLPPDRELSGINDLLSRPIAGKPLHAALAYLRSHASLLGLKSSDFANPLVTDQYTDTDSGQTHIYLEQRVGGVVIANADLSISLTRDNRVIVAGGHFLPSAAAAAASLRKQVTSTKLLSPGPALQAAAPALGLQLPAAPALLSATGRVVTPTLKALGVSATLKSAEASTEPISATLEYAPTPAGLRPAWQMVLKTPDGQHWFNTAIDGITGALLGTTDWAYHFGGSSGGNGLTAVAPSTSQTTSDRSANAAPAAVAPATETYNVYPLPLKSPQDGPRGIVTSPADPAYSPAGWVDNNGTDAPDSSTTSGNNVIAYIDAADANTPSFQPGGGPSQSFDFPIDYSQPPEANMAAAVTQLFYVTNELHDIHAHYGFTEAAGNFQQTNYTQAGEDRDPLIAQGEDGGGTNNSNMQVPPDGQSPIMQMYLWDKTTPQRDGDFSTDVIVHEYGHGVSTRLTGGPENSSSLFALQSASMGEGWSDFWALMFTQKPADTQDGGYGIGDYVLGQGNDGVGIRHYPYSFNKAINPLTFADFGANGNVEVHTAGEIWTSALWDMNWLLIQKYGYSPDISQGYNSSVPGQNGGNNLALQLVMNALKLQPVNPSFTDARDAILAADQALNGGKDLLQLWTAFARRGLGASAADISAGVNFLTPAFDLPQSLASPRVVSSSPVGTHTTPVSSVDFTFSKAMNPASFSPAADITSFTGPGGLDLKSSVTSFTWLNSNTTLRISFTAPNADGQYALAIGPNILSAGDNLPMDQNANGLSGELVDDEYIARFGHTTQPLAVASVSPAPGTVVALPFTTLDVHFNQPVNAASVNSYTLLVSRGKVTAAAQLDSTTVEYTLSGLNAEGPVSFVLPAGALKALTGTDSTAYSANFTIDIGTIPFPAPFYPESPYGRLIWERTTTGNIYSVGDNDNFTLALDAGQTLSAIVSATDATLRPSIDLLDTGGQVISSSAAPSDGQPAVLQTGTIATAGTYTLRVRGTNATIGNYSVRAILNSAVEAQEYGGPSDGTLATAQDLDPSFIAMSNGASRGAVLGHLGSGGPIIAADDFSSTILGPQWSTYSSDPVYGEVFVANVKPGQNALLMDHLHSSTLTYNLNEAIWTVDLAGISSPTLRFGQTNFGDSLDPLPTDFVGHENGDGVSISGDGIHWHRIWDAVTTSNSGIFGPIVVNLAQAAAQAGFVPGANFKIKFQQFDVSPIPENGRGFDNISIQAAATAPDYYKVSLNAGDSTSIEISGQGARGGQKVELYDSAGSLLAAASAGNSNRDLTLSDFVAPLAGEYYIRVSGDTASDYLLTVSHNAEFDTGQNTTNAQPILSAAVADIRTVLGHIDPNSSAHRYGIFLNAGQTVTLDTATPGDGPNEPANHLDPTVQLLGPSGSDVDDNSGADGRNAHLVYTAQTAGRYIVAVNGANQTTSGDFVLSVAGAAPIAVPFTATIVYPGNNTLQDGPPAQIDVTLSQDVAFSSVKPGDILLDGVPAVSVSLIEGRTLSFGPASVVGDGIHLITLSAGAFTDLSGEPNAATSASFTIDRSPPRILTSSIQQSDSLSPGALTFTATFSEPMAVDGIDASSVQLRGALSSSNFQPADLTFDATGTVLTVTYQNLPEDNYTLTLVSGPSDFRDIAQNALDGEPAWPISPAGTGDGAAGGNFFVDFQVDIATAPFGKPLTPQLPAGSLVYDATTQGAINSQADTDRYTIKLNHGSTASIDIHPRAGDWRPTITLLDPDGNPVGTTVASAANGSDAVLQIAPLATDGTYTLVIGSAGGFGAFSTHVVSDALIEDESAGGPSNNTPATAQNIDGGFSLLPGGIGTSRAAVIGATDVGSNDNFSLTLMAGEQLTLAMSAGFGGSASMILLDASGTIVASNGAAPSNLAASIPGFVAPSSGLYTVQIDGNTSFAYTLLALRDGTFDFEPNSSVATLQDLGATGTALGNVSVNDADNYRFTAGAGQIVTIDLSAVPHSQGNASLRPQLELFDAGEVVVASDTASAVGGQAKITYTIPSGASGSYHIGVEAAAGAGEYVLVVSGATADATDGAPQLSPESDSGISDTDRLTAFNNSSTTGRLQFVVPNTIGGGRVDILANGVLIATATGSDNTTNVTTDGITALNDGHYLIVARQTLANEDITLESTALPIEIKTSKPSSPAAPLLDRTSDSGNSGSDGVTAVVSPLLDINSPVYWRLFRDGVQISDDYSRGNTFSSTSLGEGTYRFTLATVDAEGNQSAVSAPLVVKIDTTAPSVNSVSAPAVTTLHGTSYEFRVTFADSNGIDILSIGGDNVVVTGPAGYSQSADLVSADLSTDGTSVAALYSIAAPSAGWTGVYNGTYAINLQAKQILDKAGNAASEAAIGSFVVTLPIEPPLTPQLSPETDSGFSATDGLTKFNNASPASALKFIIQDTNRGGTVTVYADGIEIGSAVATDTSTVVTTNGAAKLIDGSHQITARQTGDSGTLTASSAALTITIKTATLATPDGPLLDLASDSGISNSDGITNIASPTFDINAGTYFRLYLNGVPEADFGQGATYTLPGTLPDGTYSVAVTAADDAGNESSLSTPISITIDTKAPVLAPSGTLDSTFGNNGIAGFDVPQAGQIVAAALQADGKIIALGSSPSAEAGQGHSSVTLVRYNSDGSRDLTYGTAGAFVTSFAPTGIDHPTAIAIHADGKALIGGNNGTQAYLQRFGPGGLEMSRAVWGANTVLSNILPLGNGKIIVAGQINGVFGLARLLTTGALDPSFGMNGSVATPFPASSTSSVSSVVLTPTGQILAVGTANGAGGATFALARYNSNGKLDTTFGTGGLTTTRVGGSTTGKSLAVLPDGKIVAAGTSSNVGSQVALARYTANGILDTNFGNAGVVNQSFTSSVTVSGMVIQPDGKVVVSGSGPDPSVDAPGNTDSIFVARFSSTGAYDPAFNGTGHADFSVAAGGADSGILLLEPDGGLVVGGYASPDIGQPPEFVLARIIGSGTDMQLDAGSDTGVTNNDSLTSNTSPLFDVTNRGDSYYRIYLDGTLISDPYEDAAGYLVPMTSGVVTFSLVDLAGNESSLGNSTPVTFDTQPPLVENFQASGSITSPTTAPYQVTISYNDQIGMDYSTIDGSDLILSGQGFSEKASLVSLQLRDGHRGTAIYQFVPPNGGWDGTNNGVYTVVLQPGQVADLAGNTANQRTIVTIRANVAEAVAVTFSATPSLKGAGVDHYTLKFAVPVFGLSVATLSLSRGGGTNLLGPEQTLTTQDNITWTLGNVSRIASVAGTYRFSLLDGVSDAAGNNLSGTTSITQVAKIFGRHIFYNDSTFDGKNVAANSADDKAIDTTKSVLLPGGNATFASYSSYVNGINGVMIDVAGLPNDALSASDFQIFVSSGLLASGWRTGPTPASVVVRRGAGVGGSDRIELIWPDRAIVNTWLGVRILANVRTGLLAPDVFYFGNVVGETGNNPADAAVTASDVLADRAHLTVSPVWVTNGWDFNRDGVVTNADVLISRSDQGAKLQLMTPPPALPTANAVKLQILKSAPRAGNHSVDPDVSDIVGLSLTPNELAPLRNHV